MDLPVWHAVGYLETHTVITTGRRLWRSRWLRFPPNVGGGADDARNIHVRIRIAAVTDEAWLGDPVDAEYICMEARLLHTSGRGRRDWHSLVKYDAETAGAGRN